MKIVNCDLEVVEDYNAHLAKWQACKSACAKASKSACAVANATTTRPTARKGFSTAAVMVYHSQLDTSQCELACGLPLIPLGSKADHSATESKSRDIIDETLFAFRANILFRNFEVKGVADKLLIYLTLFVSLCLTRESYSTFCQEMT